MTAEFITPGLIGAIIAAIVIEAAALYILFPALRRASDVWMTLVSGAALMGAVGIALAGGDRRWIAAALTGALIAHLLYLRSRINLRKDAKLRK